MDELEKKFERVISEQLVKKIQDIGIFQNSEGMYDLFNTYYIQKIGEKLYKLSVYKTYTEHQFYSLKNAVTWCIFDKREKITESKRILELDQKLKSVDYIIDLHRQLIRKSKDSDQKLIYFAKLTDEKIKRIVIAKELSRYINESKSWQERRFADNNL